MKLPFEQHRFLLLLCFLLFASFIQAQNKTQDVVYLKNGSIIKGKVLGYEPAGQLTIEIRGGTILVYEGNQVQSIRQEAIEVPETSNTTTTAPAPKKKPKRSPHIPERGTHPIGFISNMTGIRVNGFGDFGLEIGVGLLYQYKNWLSVGAGMSLYVVSEGSFTPFYASIRTYLPNKSAAFYAEMNAGYGAALGGGFADIFSPFRLTKIEGGLYLRPALGVRFASTRRTHVALDLGYMMQWVARDYVDDFNNQYYDRITLFRPSIRVSLCF